MEPLLLTIFRSIICIIFLNISDIFSALKPLAKVSWINCSIQPSLTPLIITQARNTLIDWVTSWSINCHKKLSIKKANLWGWNKKPGSGEQMRNLTSKSLIRTGWQVHFQLELPNKKIAKIKIFFILIKSIKLDFFGGYTK